MITTLSALFLLEFTSDKLVQMWYLYLDESGDLGFDFVNKKPSKFFVITILAVRTRDNERKLRTAVRRTLKKVNHKRKRSRLSELKGSQMDMHYRKYMYDKFNFPHAIYSIVINKRKVFDSLANDKSRVYNYIARLLTEKLPFEKADRSIQFFIDKSKTKPEIDDFNHYIESHLEGRLSPSVNLDIIHEDSASIHGLQAVDIFSYGIFRKYEKSNLEWYDCFKGKIAYEEVYFNGQ